jgi:hypothetical protein
MGNLIPRFRTWLNDYSFILILIGVVSNSIVLGAAIFMITAIPDQIKIPGLTVFGIVISLSGVVLGSALLYALYQEREVTIHFEGLDKESTDAFLDKVAQTSHMKEPEATNERED